MNWLQKGIHIDLSKFSYSARKSKIIRKSFLARHNVLNILRYKKTWRQVKELSNSFQNIKTVIRNLFSIKSYINLKNMSVFQILWRCHQIIIATKSIIAWFVTYYFWNFTFVPNLMIVACSYLEIWLRIGRVQSRVIERVECFTNGVYNTIIEIQTNYSCRRFFLEFQ